jgi:Mitochondrial carrier protein
VPVFIIPRARCLPGGAQETVKTRMQVSGAGIGPTVSAIVKNEGIPSFWKGLFFAYGRELSYTSIKLGAYAPVRDALGAGKDAPFYLKFLAGAITGGVGSFIGNPFDVLKTLQVSAGRLVQVAATTW